MQEVFKLSLWLDASDTASVLMIDDLSDAYIDKYNEEYKNDWGYLTDKNGSSYSYLVTNLLSIFPEIKITFFVPYLKHNVIADKSYVIKNNISDRDDFIRFVNKLISRGHEIAYHGSNHGIYKKSDWFQEWELFKSQDEANLSVKTGIEYFDKKLGINIVGGKYCGYKYNEFSDKSIVSNGLKYWCKDATLDLNADLFINSNGLLEFPTNLAGNAFVRYLYKKEIFWKDLLSKLLYPMQFIKNKQLEKKIRASISNGKIISIQEHYSPSTTRGVVQSCNIISDIQSLKRIFNILKEYDIWYATCSEITDYHLLRESSSIELQENKVIITVEYVNIKDELLTIEFPYAFSFSKINGESFKSKYKRNKHFLTIPVSTGKNIFILDKISDKYD